MKYSNYSYPQYHATAATSAFATDGGVCEYHIILRGTDPTLCADKQLHNLLEAAECTLHQLPGTPKAIFRRFLTSDPANMPCVHHHTQAHDSIVGQPPLDGTKIALWVYAATDMECTTLPSDASVRTASHGDYRHLWMALRHDSPQPDSKADTTALLGRCIDILYGQGCTLRDECMRTWFFVHDIDIYYKGMVEGRNQVFDRQGLTSATHYIASTGIGGIKASERASLVSMDAYAVGGILPEQISYLKASEYLNRTSDYGVAFERATAIAYGDRRHVLVSGTASINNRGEIMHTGDVLKQSERMMQNVEALLAEGGCQLTDVTHLIIYLRDPADYTVVNEYFNLHYAQVPKVIVWAPVCRAGWLIEVECNAINGNGDARFAQF